jgi:uncharacterized protein (DUF58 family)
MGTRALSNLSLPSFSPAKDPADHPAFKGEVSRMLWRLLTQRLTPAGRWFGAATIVLASYGGASNMQLQSYVPAGYIGAVWLVAIVAMLFHRPRVRLFSRYPTRITAKEVMTVELRIEQPRRGRGADLAVLPHNLPAEIDSVPSDGIALPDLLVGSTTQVRLGLRCNQRGKYVLKGFRVESGFPFGIIRSRQTFREQQAILVYPAFTALSQLRLPTGRRYQPGGVALASKLGESFEYLGNREFRDGDNVRDIDWRATARLGRPIVREWVEEYMLRVAVILDTHAPKPEQAESFEHAVSIAAAVSDYMARQDYLVDLFAAGPNLYHLTAGRSLAYLEQILEILACVEANPNEPFDVIEPQLAELLSRISTVICVFLDWNDARRAFVRCIHQHGVAVKVIIVRDEKCSQNPANETDLGEVPVLSSEDCSRGIEEL